VRKIRGRFGKRRRRDEATARAPARTAFQVRAGVRLAGRSLPSIDRAIRNAIITISAVSLRAERWRNAMSPSDTATQRHTAWLSGMAGIVL
jgi:hypothetical protein